MFQKRAADLRERIVSCCGSLHFDIDLQRFPQMLYCSHALLLILDSFFLIVLMIISATKSLGLESLFSRIN